MRKIRFKRLVSSILYGTYVSGDERMVSDAFAKHCVEELKDCAEYVDESADNAPKKRQTIKRRVAKNVERQSYADDTAD